MALSNFNTRIFSSLKHLPFFKTKLVSHSIEVRSHCNLVKPFLVYVVEIMERAMLKKSFLAIAGLLFRFLTLLSDSG